MGTYRELQDRICLDYLNRSNLYAETKRAIQSSIRQYEAHRFWFNQTSTAVATVAQQTYLSVPSNFIALDYLEILNGGAYVNLRMVSFDTLRQMNPVSATAVPTHFAYRGDRFELAMIPDSAYAVNCYYIQSLPALSADTDTNAWTTEAQNLIAHCATVEMLISVLHVEDDNRVARHEQLMSAAWQELNLRGTQRVPSRIKPTRF